MWPFFVLVSTARRWCVDLKRQPCNAQPLLFIAGKPLDVVSSERKLRCKCYCSRLKLAVVSGRPASKVESTTWVGHRDWKEIVNFPSDHGKDFIRHSMPVNCIHYVDSS